MRIWISLSGTITPLHYDRCHGILIQLVGRNSCGLFTMRTPAACTLTAASQGQVTPTKFVDWTTASPSTFLRLLTQHQVQSAVCSHPISTT
ncbi:MAG: hypothetical protein BYD32DRAFT_411350 [Podila humilis]|nr:MAG: hypothetical protein BYD32DRAFT_411350 [Podila humilis]